MKVCVLAWSFYDYDNRIRREAEALIERGDTVDVICLRGEGDKRQSVIGGVNVYKIQDRKVKEKSRIDYLLQIFKFLVLTFFWVSKLHMKNKYDVIHVHSVPDFEVFAAVIPKASGAKIILDIHDIVPEFYARKFSVSPDSIMIRALKLVEKVSILFSNHVIVANDIWRDRLIQRSVQAKKCTTILNLPDPKFFQRKTIDKYDDFTLIYHGTQSSHQGVDTAIKAVKIIEKEIPALRLLLYGEGTGQESLKSMVGQLGLQDKIHFHTPVPVNEIAGIIPKCHIGIDPKKAGIFSEEALGTKIFEFMVLGLPVIASRTKVHDHYFADSGIMFFEPGNEEELARCILDLYRDQNKRERLARQSDQFLARYDWSIHKKVFYGVYDNLVRHRKAMM